MPRPLLISGRRRIEELETMEGQTFDEEFYLLDLDDAGLSGADVPRTFG
jgi:hypothetical protein